MTVSRKAQLATLPTNYVTCRVVVGNHSPDSDPRVMSAPGGGYEIVFTCRFCGTEIVKHRDRHGFVTGGRVYKYPDGYLLEEGGAMTASEKARLFVVNAGLSPAAKRGRCK